MGMQGSRFTYKNALLVFGVLSVAVYLPAFLLDYAVHNDYLRWAYAKSDFFGFPETIYLVVLGRPLGALFLNVVFYFIDSVGDFAFARLVSFLFASAFSLLIVKYLTRMNVGTLYSMAIAFGILALPATQAYVVWVALFVPGSLTIFIAGVSYIVLDRMKAGADFRVNIAYLSGAFLLFIGALMTYPPAAMAFLVFPFARALFSDDSSWLETRKTVLRDMVFSAAGMAAYYVTHRFILLPFLASRFESVWDEYRKVMEHPKYALNLTTDVFDKARLFIKLTGIAVSGVWHFLFGSMAAVAVITFFIVCAVYIFYKEVKSFKGPLERKRAAWRGVQRGLLAFVLIILACSPMLAAQPSWVHYRMTFAYAAMAVVALFWVFERLNFHLGPVQGRISQAVMVVLVAAIGIISFRNVMDVSRNANKELAFVRQKLASVDDISRIKYIEMITIPWGATYIGRDLKYDFGYSAANFNPINCIIGSALEDMGVKRDSIALETLQLGRVKEKYLDENTLVLDMNEARFKGGSYKDEIIPVAVSSSAGDSNPARAFGEVGAWKATGYPQWIRMDYPEWRTLEAYGFLCKALDSIPSRWELQASDDGNNWTILDEQDIRSDETYMVKGLNVPKGWRLLSSDDRGEHWVTADRIDYEKKGRIYALDRVMALDKAVSYKMYRVLFTDGNSDSIRIDRIQLIEGGLN